MPKAHVDPTELRRFARDLTRFNAELQALVAGLRSRMRELDKTWQDQEQRRFAEEFEQTVKGVSRFTGATEQHIQFLQQRAGHIEEYLRQH